MVGLLLPGETPAQAFARLGFDPRVNPPAMYDQSRAERRARGEAWLSSEPLWAPEGRMGPMPEWGGVKVLGEGGNGTAGKWQLLHRRPPVGDPNRLPFFSVVIKQQAGAGDMQNEARIYELMRHIESQHLVKMYRRLYQDRGLNTVRADRRGPVYRIYLEDCPNGDMISMIESSFKQR